MTDSRDYISSVKALECRAFIERCMVAVGTDPSHSASLAELLVSADERGHFSHGLNRLDHYVRDMEKGLTKPNGQPVILKDMAGTAWVDGQNLLGPVVGQFCTELVIKKARESGVGCVVAKGSNHYGIAGWYSMKIMEAGMIGFSFTNTSPVVVPTRSKKAILGTSPISCSAPAENGDSFVLDMATSTVSHGKLEMCHLTGQPLPNGWACDANGKETNSFEAVADGGGLLPLGGVEESGGYTGSGLSTMVEILTGVLGGAKFGSNNRDWRMAGPGELADLGQCFMAINLEAFAPGFPTRLSSLISMCRNADPAEGETEVLIAGDPERKHMTKVAQEGIKYHQNLFTKMDELAARLGVEPIKRK